VGDPIAHSNAMAGLLMGAALGAALAVAVVATGGLAAVAAGAVLAGGAAGGALAGQYIGAASMGPPTGAVSVGSPDVFINHRPAALAVLGLAACAKDGPAPLPIAMGAATVFINHQPLARKDDKVTCGAVIIDGSPDVLVDDQTLQLLDVAPEVPAWLTTTLQVVALGAAVVGFGVAVAAVGAGVALAGLAGSVVVGAAGSMAGRHLGEALGLSEAGTRALEVGGGFLGGMAGGGLAARGAQSAMRGWQPKSTTGVVFKEGWSQGPPSTVSAVRRMPQEFQSEYAAARAAGWRKPDGSTWWPPNDGAVGAPQRVTLPAGQRLDRFGGEHGSFTSPSGQSFDSRALAPSTNPKDLHQYQVSQPVPADRATVAPWFDKPGGGTQLKLAAPEGWPPGRPVNVAEFKKAGLLKDYP
jgi:uncharacterized Zn-binding protein involved in type VI secretion